MEKRKKQEEQKKYKKYKVSRVDMYIDCKAAEALPHVPIPEFESLCTRLLLCNKAAYTSLVQLYFCFFMCK